MFPAHRSPPHPSDFRTKVFSVNPFDNRETVSHYEAWYTTSGKRADRLEKVLLSKLVARFPAAHTLLEVGCGTGHFTRWFPSCGLHSTGIDSSRPMLAEAKRQGTSRCLQANAEQLPFPKNAFDLVVYITALEFMKNPAEALTEGLRVARRGLILGILNRQSLLGAALHRKGGAIWQSAHLFTPGELDSLIRHLGFRKDAYYRRTTLFRCLPWSSRLPWGGFIGAAIIKTNQ